MSPARRHRLAELSRRWALDAGGPWDADALTAAFGRDAPRLLDVGPGHGEATVAWAQDHPDHDVVAVELHLPGLLHLLGEADALGLGTIRATEADATAVVAAAEPGAFAHVRVLFPDPWPKRRHVGRRLVDEHFVPQVADLLPVGGTLALATDWADYASQMRRCLATDPRLAVELDTQAGGAEGERPARPVTAYERRGLAAGRTITDLVARRTR